MRIGRYINEVCALLDANVLTDLDGDVDNLKVVVAIGIRVDHSAGETGCIITKWFSTEEELDEFCELNINRFRIASQQETVVDATEWR
jgi:hypothetical protein